MSQPQPRQGHEDSAIVAAALVFDPPVIASEPAPSLDRDGRELSAFVGYDQSVTTFYYLRNNDRQSFDDPINGRFERRAVSESFVLGLASLTRSLLQPHDRCLACRQKPQGEGPRICT